METQIIKLNPLAANIKEDFNRLVQRLQNSNSQVTVIVKPSSSSEDDNRFESKRLHSSRHHQNKDRSYKRKTLKSSIFNKKKQELVFDGEVEESQHNLEQFLSLKSSRRDSDSNRNTENKKYNLRGSISQNFINKVGMAHGLQQGYDFYISNKEVLPNIQINLNNSKHRKRVISIESQEIKNYRAQNQSTAVQAPESQKKDQKKEEKLQTPPLTDEITIQSQLSSKSLSSEGISTQKQNDEGEQSIVESLFAVQDKLNDAVKFIKNNKLFELEEYLYEFKAKYNCMSNRVQMKWRLLMAYCKQKRKQFERAAILYKQVLELTQTSLNAPLVQAADIHHRLGICYTETKNWNEGIIQFASALKQYDKNSKKIKYAECLNNLGTLYLTAEQFSQAQKCFVISYQVKKKEYSENSRRLISTLLNLYECNLLGRNYEQAENILKEVESIISPLKQVNMLNAGLWRRKGKLAFLRGDLKRAQQFYLKSKELLQTNYPYSLQYADLCKNLAMIRLEQSDSYKAKQLLDVAFSRFNFYYSKDSYAIQNIKSIMQLVDRKQVARGELSQIYKNGKFFDTINEKQN